MKTYIQPGNTITLTAPYAVAAGDGLLVGSIFGVASGTAALGETVETALVGVYELKKLGSQAWAVGARALVSVDLATGELDTLATALPVKAPPGVAPKILGGVGTMSGPMEPFAGVAVDGHGTIYIAGDAEGSILTLSNP